MRHPKEVDIKDGGFYDSMIRDVILAPTKSVYRSPVLLWTYHKPGPAFKGVPRTWIPQGFKRSQLGLGLVEDGVRVQTMWA